MDRKSEESATQNRSKAMNLASLRALVAAYLIYLGISLIYDHLSGRSSLSPVFVWLTGLFFILAGICFGFYIWKRWRTDTQASRNADDKSPLDNE